MTSSPFQVTLAGQPISGIDSEGTRWRISDEEGRYSLPARRRSREARPQQDGAFPSRGALGERTMTLQGTMVAVDRAACLRSRMALIVAARQDGHLVWVDDLGQVEAAVEVDAGPRFEWLSDRVLAWQLTVTAPDPVWYGVQQVQTLTLDLTVPVDGWDWAAPWPAGWGVGRFGSATDVLVANAGATTYWPRLRIDGPAVNPRISSPDTGGSVQVGVTLLPGQWLDIDARERAVLHGGSLLSRHLTTWSGSGLAVAPGASQRLVLTVDDPDDQPTMTVWSYEGAWL